MHATVSPTSLSNHFQALGKRKGETVGEKMGGGKKKIRKG